MQAKEALKLTKESQVKRAEAEFKWLLDEIKKQAEQGYVVKKCTYLVNDSVKVKLERLGYIITEYDRVIIVSAPHIEYEKATHISWGDV